MGSLLEQIKMEDPPLNQVSLESRLDNHEMLEDCLRWIHVMTELRCLMKHEFNNYGENVHGEQASVLTRIDNNIQVLAKQEDEHSTWNAFAFERQKQELVIEEKLLQKINN
jgi:hypothetical protein